MRTIFAISLIALIISLILTPLFTRLAHRLGWVDKPDARKVHVAPTPRVGGMAIFLSTVLAFVPLYLVQNNIWNLIAEETRMPAFVTGACIVFFMGLMDDIYGLRARFKLLVQIFAGLVLFAGGVRIELVAVPEIASMHLDLLSLPVTVFWVILVINAINLIDGLDGLAAGVSLMVSVILLVFCLINGRLLMAVMLAGLSGSILGFLRYNFNPASIFMGDSGSYFLGYAIAGMSVMGSIKSQTALSVLIPMIALGVPLMDTAWATLRRFAVGRELFSPDKNHFHHRLLRLGYTQRRAVLTLYGITILAGFAALGMVYLHDAQVAILFLLIFLGVFVGIRQLGYLDYLNSRRLRRWTDGLLNEVGLKKTRRLLNAHQIRIYESRSLDEYWDRVVDAIRTLGVDYLRIRLWNVDELDPGCFFDQEWHLNDNTRDVSVLYQYNRLYLRYPLERGGRYYGNFIISKEAFDSEDRQLQTLSHIEHLRRTLADTLDKLYKENRYPASYAFISAEDPCLTKIAVF